LQRSGATTRRLNRLPRWRNERSQRSAAATMRPHGPPHQRRSRSRKSVGQPSQRYECSRRSVAAAMRPHGLHLWRNSRLWRRVAATILRPRLLSQPRWRWLKSDNATRRSPRLPRWRKRLNRQRIGRSSMRAVTIRQRCVQWNHPRRSTAFQRQFGAFRQHAIPSPLL
jgi:hypothetical protein